MMKKLLMLALLTVSFTTANAQIEKGRRLGVGAGIGVATLTGDGSFDGKFAFSVKFSWEENFSNKLYLATGLGLDCWGYTNKYMDGSDNTFYLTLPIHIGTRFNLFEDKIHLFCDAGPQIAIGLFDNGVDLGFGTSYFFDNARRFDLGLGARVGVDVGDMQVYLGFNGGLIPVVKDTNNHNFDFQVGYIYIF